MIFDPKLGGKVRTALYVAGAIVGTLVVVLTSAPESAWTPVVLQWLTAIASGIAHLSKLGSATDEG